MYARVTTIYGQPGKTNEAIRIFESLPPRLQIGNGYIGMQLLVDRTANAALVVTLYDTLADLVAGEAVFQQSLAQPSVEAILAGPPDVAVYEVALQLEAKAQ